MSSHMVGLAAFCLLYCCCVKLSVDFIYNDRPIRRFHKLVTRCYCPSEEVAKRALRAGLQRSQIKVYGLPVRPSFVKAVRPKVALLPDSVYFFKSSNLR